MADTKRKPLTADLAIKNAKCAEGKRSTRYSCGGLGLYLDVKAGGARSFMLCVMVHGKRIERGLGSYPQVTLEQAREKAIVFTRRLRNGEDVGAKAAKAATAGVVTFKQAAESYLELQDEEGNYKPALNGEKSVHRKQWDYSLETFVFPKIGHVDVNEIRISDLTAIFQPIWKTKYATALKTRQRVALVLDHCVDMGWRDENLANPARHKSPAFKKPKNLETKKGAPRNRESTSKERQMKKAVILIAALMALGACGEADETELPLPLPDEVQERIARCSEVHGFTSNECVNIERQARADMAGTEFIPIEEVDAEIDRLNDCIERNFRDPADAPVCKL